jgi:hypothetical protein
MLFQTTGSRVLSTNLYGRGLDGPNTGFWNLRRTTENTIRGTVCLLSYHIEYGHGSSQRLACVCGAVGIVSAGSQKPEVKPWRGRRAEKLQAQKALRLGNTLIVVCFCPRPAHQQRKVL